jgi:hypothetical protein
VLVSAGTSEHKVWDRIGWLLFECPTAFLSTDNGNNEVERDATGQ